MRRTVRGRRREEDRAAGAAQGFAFNEGGIAMKHKRILILLAAAALLALALAACGANASVIRLARTEGGVQLWDEKQVELTPKEQLSLHDGYRMATEAAGYGWLSLDEKRLAKLDENSAVGVESAGKQLKLTLERGSLFFHIEKPLSGSESMEISTSNMTVGIRGTCGWVSLQGDKLLVRLLEGKVECTVTTADGETVTQTVEAGQKAALSPDGTITVSQLSEADIPAFVWPEIEGSDALAEALGAISQTRPMLLNASDTQAGLQVAPAAASFAVEADFSNVINFEEYSYALSDEARQKLLQNGFVVLQSSWGGQGEFFDLYESNRYAYRPNFVTTDSMMHTYHLYFSRLLKGVERDYFSAELTAMTQTLLEQSAQQLSALAGTPWENAARRNVAYFSVAASLLQPGASVPGAVSDLVSQELALIEAAQGIAPSPVMNAGGGEDPLLEDYSQYIPRGYYTTSEELSRYFRAMMWYGRLAFRQSDEDQTRSALLMTVALKNSAAMEQWEKIYTISSFFVGTSDDPGVYEYAPLIEQAYGGMPDAAQLPAREDAWNSFRQSLAQLAMPSINSIPIEEDLSEEERAQAIIGFRLMGQRAVLDAQIFQQLIDGKVPDRMLPSALDVPAALGSEAAREMLRESGADNYPNYTQNMQTLQNQLADAPATLWNASLYGGWLNTLRPLTEAKGEGWPQFMQNDAWAAKSVNTFLGSWTELKHDTVLYSKQVYAEMGGGGIDEKDDRGYVEPEPVLYARLSALAAATRDGLSAYGVLREADADALTRMVTLADGLKTISEKELTNTPRTEEEYTLIREFGGDLEHFWYEVLKDEATQEYFTSQEYPAALVTDVATDPNGQVLEVGTGGVEEILVIVDIDGSLRIASGGVYSFYEFAQPISDRLTDAKWWTMLGINMWDENGNYVDARVDVPRPAWTSRFAAPMAW